MELVCLHWLSVPIAETQPKLYFVVWNLGIFVHVWETANLGAWLRMSMWVQPASLTV
jgi:hypothetical protein